MSRIRKSDNSSSFQRERLGIAGVKVTGLSGQWIGRYTGSNKGTFVVELDDVGDHYEGSATAWDEVHEHFNAQVNIRTTSKESKQTLGTLPVTILSSSGDAVPIDYLARLQNERQITYPATIDLSVNMNGKTLEVSWVSPTGNSCTGVATMPKTRDGQKSQLKTKNLKTWNGFKKVVNNLERKRFIYRGQESSE